MAWICFSDAFLSIVDDGEKPGYLVVRARRRADIPKVFPGVKPVTLRGRDYQFRAHIPRETVALTIMENIMNIKYSNFKNSVRDDDLHNAYSRFWSIHSDLQPKPPYRM